MKTKKILLFLVVLGIAGYFWARKKGYLKKGLDDEYDEEKDDSEEIILKEEDSRGPY
ncbi:MAG: hypothetical protein WC459_02910 [Patescibacteria group bacterium]